MYFVSVCEWKLFFVYVYCVCAFLITSTTAYCLPLHVCKLSSQQGKESCWYGTWSYSESSFIDAPDLAELHSYITFVNSMTPYDCMLYVYVTSLQPHTASAGKPTKQDGFSVFPLQVLEGRKAFPFWAPSAHDPWWLIWPALNLLKFSTWKHQ